jgi:Zn-dependent protease
MTQSFLGRKRFMSGFRLGKFFGLNTYIHWSWLLIFGLVVWSLASTLKQVHPEWSSFDQVALAMVVALLFFLSVVAHEIAHSLAAKARAHPVSRTVASKKHRARAGIAVARWIKMSMSFYEKEE